MDGPMVCIINEFFRLPTATSFPYRFRKYKLGKLIGKSGRGGGRWSAIRGSFASARRRHPDET